MSLPGEANRWHVPNGYMIFLSFHDGMLIREEEYFVYDFNAIVAAVGGGLGLFLGFSVLSVAMKLISCFALHPLQVTPDVGVGSGH